MNAQNINWWLVTSGFVVFITIMLLYAIGDEVRSHGDKVDKTEWKKKRNMMLKGMIYAIILSGVGYYGGNLISGQKGQTIGIMGGLVAGFLVAAFRDMMSGDTKDKTTELAKPERPTKLKRSETPEELIMLYKKKKLEWIQLMELHAYTDYDSDTEVNDFPDVKRTKRQLDALRKACIETGHDPDDLI